MQPLKTYNKLLRKTLMHLEQFFPLKYKSFLFLTRIHDDRKVLENLHVKLKRLDQDLEHLKGTQEEARSRQENVKH